MIYRGKSRVSAYIGRPVYVPHPYIYGETNGGGGGLPSCKTGSTLMIIFGSIANVVGGTVAVVWMLCG